jgi:calcium-dependent protein kinase
VSGIVRLVTHKSTGVKYAVKCLDIGLIDSMEGLRQLRNEIFIMCQLDHPNIVRIEEVYESTNEIYILQELCVGGDLFDRLDEQPDFHYTEAQCARLVKQMLSAVRYLHSKGIIHRDLKLENFLFSSQKADSELKMIDFGLSKHFEIGESHHDKASSWRSLLSMPAYMFFISKHTSLFVTLQVGTPYTVAPEIIQGAYDEKSDIWAVGVITYLLLSGETPFGGLDGESLLLVKANIMRAQVLFEPADVWDHVSEDGKAYVKRLLQPDPKKRPTAKEVQKDQWIQVWAKKDAKEGKKLNSKTLESLVAFKETSDMQKILSEVLSFTLLPDQIIDLRKEFELMDTDGDGEISFKALRKVLADNAEAGMLGALTEQEIEDIFDAMKTRKNEPTIRWHEFLAAGLSQARVDERNLRLAFDRLDTHRRG